MRILFAISVLCLCVLLWAAYSIARHVREGKQPRPRRARAHPAFQQPLFDSQGRGTSAAAQAYRSAPPQVPDTPPRTAQPATRQRPDWAYFKEDMGDLTDPYQPQRPRTKSGDAPPAPNRR